MPSREKTGGKVNYIQNKETMCLTEKHLSKHYHFKLADDVCNQYNRFVILMRKEEENSEGKYPWLEDTDERKYMTDREILDKYINLDNSCLTKIEKTQVRDVLYRYKDAFSFRDKIGLCLNIEIEIDVTDKFPFSTLSMPHATIVAISRLVETVPSQELLCATEFSMRLV